MQTAGGRGPGPTGRATAPSRGHARRRGRPGAPRAHPALLPTAAASCSSGVRVPSALSARPAARLSAPRPSDAATAQLPSPAQPRPAVRHAERGPYVARPGPAPAPKAPPLQPHRGRLAGVGCGLWAVGCGVRTFPTLRGIVPPPPRPRLF